MPLAGPVGPSRAFRFRATREDKPMTARNPAAPHAALPRVAALVGPYTAGKTTLLEALLFAAGALPRKGSVANGSSLGDAAPEAPSRPMTIDPNKIGRTQGRDTVCQYREKQGISEHLQKK